MCRHFPPCRDVDSGLYPARRWPRSLFSIFILVGLCGLPQMRGQAGALAHSATSTGDLSGLEVARSQIRTEDFARADSTLRVYLSGNSSSADAHALRGYALMRLAKPKESLEEFTFAAKLRAPTAEELRSVGNDYALLEDYSDADYWTSRALLLDESDPETWYSLGRIRYSQQRYQDAAKCFEKTLQLLPHSVKAANNLGLSFEGLNRTEDAMRQYRLAIAWQSGLAHPSEQPLLNLAIILIHQDKGNEALPLLTEAVRIAPADSRIHDQLGHIYLNRGELPEAQTQFEAAVSLSPKSGPYHFLLGQVYRRRGMSLEAQRQFELAAASDANHSSPE